MRLFRWRHTIQHVLLDVQISVGKSPQGALCHKFSIPLSHSPPPAWDLIEQECRLHYLPIGCLQSLSDKRNDSVNNQDSAVRYIGVCLCMHLYPARKASCHLAACSHHTGLNGKTVRPEPHILQASVFLVNVVAAKGCYHQGHAGGEPV